MKFKNYKKVVTAFVREINAETYTGSAVTGLVERKARMEGFLAALERTTGYRACVTWNPKNDHIQKVSFWKAELVEGCEEDEE